MTYSYFPGCTLKNKAQDLDLYGRRSAEALGVTLSELPEWQCCGGEYTMAQDEIATKLASVRALYQAHQDGQDLVTLCAGCHNVIKQTNEDMRHNEYFSTRVNNYLAADNIEYHGETNVYHFLEVLRDEVGFDKIKEKVVHPFSGKKIGAYYGCLLLRPSKVMQMDNPENPKIMEDFIKAIGGEPVIYAQRNECCGAYLTLEDKNIPKNRAKIIHGNAAACGAQMLVTACPLCYYNLTKNAGSDKLPVLYFTELLAEALGVKEDSDVSNV